MTEKEKREDEALKNCIQEAYGLSDEQLLAELDELEASLSDDEFVGAEDRIYARIMQREAEREESSGSAEEVADSIEIPASNPAPIRKISKKKKWLIVGIAAALVVGASVSTIGGKNYFLKKYEGEGPTVINSGQNVVKTDTLAESYEMAKKYSSIPILKMNYMPTNLLFKEMNIINNKITFVFEYEDNLVYFIQEIENKEISKGISSDRKDTDRNIKNYWLKRTLPIEENLLEDGKIEYSTWVNIENVSYRILGILPEEEFISIVEKLNF